MRKIYFRVAQANIPLILINLPSKRSGNLNDLCQLKSHQINGETWSLLLKFCFSNLNLQYNNLLLINVKINYLNYKNTLRHLAPNAECHSQCATIFQMLFFHLLWNRCITIFEKQMSEICPWRAANGSWEGFQVGAHQMIWILIVFDYKWMMKISKFILNMKSNHTN